LKVALNEIPEEGALDVEFFEKAETLNKLFKDGGEVYFFNSPLKASFNISRKSETVFVGLFISGSLVVTCSRCLAEFQRTIKHSNRLTFFPRIGEDTDEVIVDSDEADKVLYHNNILDLGELVREEAALIMPITSLCSDSCKGLCQKCGRNLNLADCSCETSFVDKRFNVLKKLKISN